MKKLFFNGEVITVNKNFDIENSILIEDEKIVFVGDTEKARCLAGGEAEEINLEHCAVLPGFVDCHIHMAVAESKSGEEIYLTPENGIKSISDILDKIKNAAKDKANGEWIIGSAYSNEDLNEKRHITLKELDNVSPRNPVLIIHKSGHMSVCNSAALELAKKSGLQFPTEHTALTENGEPSGLMKETAHFTMLQKAPLLPDDETLVSGIEKFCKRLLNEGITSSHDAGGYGAPTFRSLQLAKEKGKLKNRVYTMLWTLFGKDAQIRNAENMVNSGFYTGFGDNNLKKGPIKIMVDGSAVGGTCATTKPIMPGGVVYPPSFSQSEINEIFLEAHRAGFQITAHAAGDKAVEMTLNAYENALKVFPRKDHRHRIEHCFLCPEEYMQKIKRLGVIPVPNPAFLSVWGESFEKYYEDRLDYLIPLKSFEKHGIITPFGSDGMVIEELSPFFGIFAAMERRDLRTNHIIGEGQQIGLVQAIRGYTCYGAYSAFEENIKGSLEPGKLSDLVILPTSLMDKSPNEIRNIKPQMVLFGGEIIA